MTTLKSKLLVLTLLLIGVVMMSFHIVKKPALAGETWFSSSDEHVPLTENPALAEQWFEYTDETGDGDPENPENYVLANGTGSAPPPCPTGNTERCAVHAQPQAGNPDLPDLNTVIDIRLRQQQ